MFAENSEEDQNSSEKENNICIDPSIESVLTKLHNEHSNYENQDCEKYPVLEYEPLSNFQDSLVKTDEMESVDQHKTEDECIKSCSNNEFVGQLESLKGRQLAAKCAENIIPKRPHGIVEIPLQRSPMDGCEFSQSVPKRIIKKNPFKSNAKAKRIISVARVRDKLWFYIEFEGLKDPVFVPAKKVYKELTDMVITYYESRVIFKDQ